MMEVPYSESIKSYAKYVFFHPNRDYARRNLELMILFFTVIFCFIPSRFAIMVAQAGDPEAATKTKAQKGSRAAVSSDGATKALLQSEKTPEILTGQSEALTSTTTPAPEIVISSHADFILMATISILAVLFTIPLLGLAYFTSYFLTIDSPPCPPPSLLLNLVVWAADLAILSPTWKLLLHCRTLSTQYCKHGVAPAPSQGRATRSSLDLRVTAIVHIVVGIAANRVSVVAMDRVHSGHLANLVPTGAVYAIFRRLLKMLIDKVANRRKDDQSTGVSGAEKGETIVEKEGESGQGGHETKTQM